MSKIIKLTVQNLLRIRAAEVTPDGALVIVAGRNDQGKSSLLNCIGIALSGKDLPAEPIRQGASSGYVILETDQFVITRKFSQTGGGSLVVHDKEGKPITSPQTKLNALYNLTTFDPLTFTRQDAKAQAATLRRLTGLDFSETDAEISRLFEERTAKGREVQMQKGRVAGIPRNTEAPTEPVSVAELTAKLQAALATNAEQERRQNNLSDLNDEIESAETNIERIRAQLAQMKDAQEKRKEHRDELRKAVSEDASIDTKALAAEISKAEETNAAVRENARWMQEHKRLTDLESEHANLTTALEQLRNHKAAQTAEAKFPVPGLGFDEAGGVTFEGHPFAQISSSKQIRVSLAIACALNPTLRVMLIRDGSLLDKDSLELVRDYAEKHQAQVFLECVGDREDANVIIEDGAVAATPEATKKKGRK